MNRKWTITIFNFLWLLWLSSFRLLYLHCSLSLSSLLSNSFSFLSLKIRFIHFSASSFSHSLHSFTKCAIETEQNWKWWFEIRSLKIDKSRINFLCIVHDFCSQMCIVHAKYCISRILSSFIFCFFFSFFLFFLFFFFLYLFVYYNQWVCVSMLWYWNGRCILSIISSFDYFIVIL